MSDQDEEPEDDDRWPWDDGLRRRLEEILASGEVEEREEGRVVTFAGSDFDAQEFSDFDDLYTALVDYGDSYLSSHVPWDDGAPAFSTESDDVVMDAMVRSEAGALFGDSPRRHKDQLLFNFDAPASVIQIDFGSINDELIRYLAKHPEMMQQLHHRKFEELVAELLRAKGYQIELTKRTRDGGRDIHAIRKDSVGTILTLVECKRYTPQHKVGVEIVRQLLGVLDLEGATNALIATTSFFTKDAMEAQRRMRFRMGLADQIELTRWLIDHKK